MVGRTPEIFPRRLHRVGDVIEALPNGSTLHLRSKGDDWVTNLVFWKGWKAYEPGTIDLFYKLAGRAGTVLDIGAYVGFFTLIAALANRQAQVFAFEPLAAIHQRLIENVRRNGLANVECLNTAVGDEDGQARFFFSMAALREGLPTSSSLSEGFMSDVPELTGIDVPLLAIDSFVKARSISRVDLVKIDTETTEPSVLKGMRAVLARDRPSIICEVLHGRADTAAIDAELRPLGYQFFLLTPTGAEPRPAIEGHPEFFNFLFTTNPERDLT